MTLAQRSPAGFLEAIFEAASTRLRVEIEPLGEQVASASIEVAGDEGQHVHQPIGECSLAAHVEAGGHVDRGAFGGCEVTSQGADVGFVQTRNGADALRRISVNEVSELVYVASVTLDRGLVESRRAIDLRQHGREEIDVGVGSDLDDVAHRRDRRLDASRVHEADRGPTLASPAQDGHRIGDAQEAHVRHGRVLAEDEQIVGVVEIGDRVDCARAEDRLAARELVGAVLGPGAERPVHAELTKKARQGWARESVEAGGIPHVGRDRIRPRLVEDLSQLAGDLAQRVVPAETLESAGRGAAERVVQAIGVVMDVEPGEAFVASVALGDRVLAVGGELYQTPVFDRCHESAGGLADSAEGGDRPGCHRRLAGGTTPSNLRYTTICP